MNEYFCSIGNKLSKKIPDIENHFLKGAYDVNLTAVHFSFSTIKPEKVTTASNKFKT